MSKQKTIYLMQKINQIINKWDSVDTLVYALQNHFQDYNYQQIIDLVIEWLIITYYVQDSFKDNDDTMCQQIPHLLKQLLHNLKQQKYLKLTIFFNDIQSQIQEYNEKSKQGFGNLEQQNECQEVQEDLQQPELTLEQLEIQQTFKHLKEESARQRQQIQQFQNKQQNISTYNQNFTLDNSIDKICIQPSIYFEKTVFNKYNCETDLVGISLLINKYISIIIQYNLKLEFNVNFNNNQYNQQILNEILQFQQEYYQHVKLQIKFLSKSQQIDSSIVQSNIILYKTHGNLVRFGSFGEQQVQLLQLPHNISILVILNFKYVQLINFKCIDLPNVKQLIIVNCQLDQKQQILFNQQNSFQNQEHLRIFLVRKHQSQAGQKRVKTVQQRAETFGFNSQISETYYKQNDIGFVDFQFLLTQCINLEVLDLRLNKFSGFNQPLKLNQLYYLDLSYNCKLHKIDGFINDSNQIQYLILKYTDIQYVQHYENLSKLKFLNLKATSLTNICEISKLCQLIYLNILKIYNRDLILYKFDIENYQLYLNNNEMDDLDAYVNNITDQQLNKITEDQRLVKLVNLKTLKYNFYNFDKTKHFQKQYQAQCNIIQLNNQLLALEEELQQNDILLSKKEKQFKQDLPQIQKQHQQLIQQLQHQNQIFYEQCDKNTNRNIFANCFVDESGTNSLFEAVRLQVQSGGVIDDECFGQKLNSQFSNTLRQYSELKKSNQSSGFNMGKSQQKQND